MADIKVKTNNNQVVVRVGQQNAIKVVASNSAVQSSGDMENIGDVDITNRGNRTFLMYNSATNTYIHVDAAQIMDLADSVDNESIDYGSF